MPLGLGTIGRLTIGGVPAQFNLDTTSGSFTLAGQNTTAFQVGEAAVSGTIAFAGQGAPLQVQARLASGALTAAGEAAFLGYDLLGGGSSISGGTFSRARWREMLAEEERRRATQEQRIRDEKLRRLGERRRREAAFAEARRRSRELARDEADAAIAALVTEHAAAAARGVDELKALAARAGAQAHAAEAARAAPLIDDDEEEAIALLLLAHAHR
jgi:hypothetical protein